MKGISLASHGRLAKGLLSTLQIFCGELQQMQALCLLPGEEITEFIERLEVAIQKVDIGEGIVIFCDLLFGSPCNCSAKLLQDTRYAGKVSVITGMNLCIILEYIGSGAASMDREALMDTEHKGIVNFDRLLRKRQAA